MVSNIGTSIDCPVPPRFLVGEDRVEYAAHDGVIASVAEIADVADRDCLIHPEHRERNRQGALRRPETQELGRLFDLGGFRQ
jgi:hypothetical protein